MKKKLLSVVLCAAMAVSMLVGCGNGGESGKQSADKSSSKNVTLDFWTIDLKATFGDFFNDLISKYEEENKGVKINWTDIPYADVQSKLVAAVDVSYSGEIPAGGVQVPFKVPSAKKGDMVYVNPKAQFIPPMEFCIGPNPDLEIGQPTDYSFACRTNADFKWELVKGKLPVGVTFQNGKLAGTPTEAGKYPITLQLSANNKNSITKDFELLVKTKNIAPKADTIYANIRKLNEEVLDSCWITFGKPMYATNVEVINDGVKDGVGSVFYSLAAKSNLPKIDYFGYGWKEEHNINMLVLDMGCLEEFGGWFTSLNIQYLGNDGHWYDVGKFKSTPALPETDIVFFQPPFAQYVLEFPAVKTKGIRVLMDAKVQEHWHKYTKNVSSFISITELGVYEK